jgi:hypothetical protein
VIPVGPDEPVAAVRGDDGADVAERVLEHAAGKVERQQSTTSGNQRRDRLCVMAGRASCNTRPDQAGRYSGRPNR